MLARAVVWGMIDSNAAKQGVDNPQRRRTEKRPFESWAQLDELAGRLGARSQRSRSAPGCPLSLATTTETASVRSGQAVLEEVGIGRDGADRHALPLSVEPGGAAAG